MRVFVLSCVGVFLLSFLLFKSNVQSQQAKKSALAWQIERITLKGASFPKLKGTQISRLRLVAFKNGKMVVIPFQIDERDSKNMFVLPDQSGKYAGDGDGGRLDDNDELAFMAADAGEKGSIEKAKNYHEVEIRNGADDALAWVYLVDFNGEPPALSSVDYVAYHRKGNREEIVTEYYIQGFNDEHVFFDDLRILPPAGGNGKNFIDKMKMRTAVQAVGGKITVARNENDFRSSVVGVVDGAVRVIRRNDTRMTLLAGVKSPSIIVDATFYKCSYEVPSVFSLPFRMDLVASGAQYRQGGDLNQNAIGMRYYNNFTLEPVVYDGKMSEREKEIARSDKTHYWGMLSGAPGTLLYVGRWQDKMPIKILAYYDDDSSALDPPENIPGQMMFGWRFENLLNVKGATYSFNLLNYIIPNFDGNIQRVVALIEKPFEVQVR